MKKNNRFFLSFIALSGLLVLASCDFNGGGVDKVDANRKVLEAVNKVGTTHIHSFELDVETNFTLEAEVTSSYDDEVIEMYTSIDANAQLAAKASKLFGDQAEASVTLDASLNLEVNEDGEELALELDGGVSAYLKDGWAYADITDVVDLLSDILGEDFPEGEEIPTKAKGHVGNLSDLLNLEPNFTLAPEPLDVDAFLPYFDEITNVNVTTKGEEITVVYTVTMDDVVDVFYQIYLNEALDEIPTTEDSPEDIKDMIRTMLEDMITIREAKLTIGVGADGFINKFYVDVDVDVNFEDEYETVDFSLQANLHIDLNNINKSVAVEFPNDLNTYVEVELPDEEDY